MKVLKTIKDKPEIFREQEFKSKYKLFLEDYKIGGVATFWNGFLFLRWTFTISILVFLRDYSSFQILLLLATSIFWQALLITHKPYICDYKTFF
jgi:hypothetical protein